MTENMGELKKIDSRSNEVIPFTNFELYLQDLGLLHEGIIASDKERTMMSMILPQTIQDLSPQTKRDAVYLSKFVASSAIGLYDAGLNYIWNEVVVSLRANVNIYGLDLFYDALERPFSPFTTPLRIHHKKFP